jgi:hypothetical protein
LQAETGLGVLAAKLATTSWVIVTFDTAGEVTAS